MTLVIFIIVSLAAGVLFAMIVIGILETGPP